jgi:hypothetical protein
MPSIKEALATKEALTIKEALATIEALTIKEVLATKQVHRQPHGNIAGYFQDANVHQQMRATIQLLQISRSTCERF